MNPSEENRHTIVQIYIISLIISAILFSLIYFFIRIKKNLFFTAAGRKEIPIENLTSNSSNSPNISALESLLINVLKNDDTKSFNSLINTYSLLLIYKEYSNKRNILDLIYHNKAIEILQYSDYIIIPVLLESITKEELKSKYLEKVNREDNEDNIDIEFNTKFNSIVKNYI